MAKVSVKYISVWDGDEIVTDAELVEETGEIVNIETVDIGNDYNACEGEFIEFPSGERGRVVEYNGSYYLYSTLHSKLSTLLDAVLGDLSEFGAEGYPYYLEQALKANTGESEAFDRLFDIIHQVIADLEEFQSENVLAYRDWLNQLENIVKKDEWE